MVTIDLGTPPPPAADFLDGLPRRLSLTLPELRLVARLAGDAPLPFDGLEPQVGASGQGEGAGLAGRLGSTRADDEQEALAAALAALHAPEETLARRGLIGEEGLDRSIAGAIGLLATPRLALDIDVATDGVRVKSWHREAAGAVATLATGDGISFELAWFPVAHWATELARVPLVPDNRTRVAESEVPAVLDAPFSTLDAVGEAIRSGRNDLVDVLIAHRDGEVMAEDTVLDDAAVTKAVRGLHVEAHGRLRVLVARPQEQEATEVGVVSWTLLADGWRSLTPRTTPDGPRVRITRVSAEDLATELAPVLAQVGA